MLICNHSITQKKMLKGIYWLKLRIQERRSRIGVLSAVHMKLTHKLEDRHRQWGPKACNHRSNSPAEVLKSHRRKASGRNLWQGRSEFLGSLDLHLQESAGSKH